MKTEFIQDFPLTSIQRGTPMGNGFLGALLWGQDHTLNVTLGCACLWDHRGGLSWTPRLNFKDIRKALEHQDPDALRNIFASPTPKTVIKPSVLPLARIVITLPPTCRLIKSVQSLDTGITRIMCQDQSGEMCLDFYADMTCHSGIICRGLDDSLDVRLIPAWELPVDTSFKAAGLCPNASLAERGFMPPECYHDSQRQAFLQQRPQDSAYGVRISRQGNVLHCLMKLDVKDLQELLDAPLEQPDQLAGTSQDWWKNYWTSVPDISLPDQELEDIYWLGMARYGIMTNPNGVPPGLQGPWLEDDRLPPWSGDYHFNINVQMCHAPGYKAGLFDHLLPLFRMILSWKDLLRNNAKCLAGIDDGYLLPHAVDDRGTCMGTFWTGCIDHASTAWIAQMMFDYCDYACDWNFLRDHVFDFMRGTMRVFQTMLETKPDGSLELPVSVSPEYRGADLNAWGHNSSFQLAAIHSLARNLQKAAEILHLTPDPFWQSVQDKLPAYASLTANGTERIALWNGLDLEESHRHHSHLGGIFPFQTLDPQAPALQALVKDSIQHWISLGMGKWAGWSFPWASQIHTRLQHPDMAIILLKLWKRCFNNSSGASLHNAAFPGMTIFTGEQEVMQMDGQMGTVAAIQDLLAYDQNGILNLFQGIPSSWKQAAFKGFHLRGGVQAEAQFHNGKTTYIVLSATNDCNVTLRTPDHPTPFTCHLTQGHKLKLTPTPHEWASTNIN